MLSKLSEEPLVSKSDYKSVGQSLNKNDRKVFLGFWTQGFWDQSTQTLHPEKLHRLEDEIGKKVAIAHYYRGWEHLSERAVVDELEQIHDNGWMPMISANPYIFDKCISKDMTLYRAIASGVCDEFLHDVGKNLSFFDKPFFFRFAWEMNISSIEWGILRTGSSPKDFVLAWRHIHEIFKNEGVTKALWVFSPQVDTPDSIKISLLYPGDNYVNWVGLDGYNWGLTQSWSSWQSFDSVFKQSYDTITEIAKTKPLMIAEVNTTNVGGNKGDWYKAMLLEDIPNKYPEINAVVFFNEDKSHKEGVSWLFDESAQSLEDFRNSIKLPLYVSNF